MATQTSVSKTAKKANIKTGSEQEPESLIVGESGSDVATNNDLLADAALKKAARDQLEADVAAFLSDGGNIAQVPCDFRADPPRKPENNYGKGNI